MKKVMVFGTFDRLHPGHRYLLEEAKKYGDFLIVVVALDETVKKIKNKTPKHSQEERKRALEKIPEVDRAVLGEAGDKYEIIRNNLPDVICLGYDQKHFTQDLSKHFPKITIYRIGSHKPHIYKSSILNK